jgi:hypothetical protein
MRPIVIRDVRTKEKFQVDDEYLNGYAKIAGFPATGVYLSLCRHADMEQKSFPSLTLLAQEHGASTKTIQRAIKVLKELNIISVEQSKNEKGVWLHNTYYLLDKSQWVKKAGGHLSPTVDRRTSVSLAGGHSNPTKVTHIKDTHTLSSISDLDFENVANYYGVPIAFVKSKYDDLSNYCLRTGKTYKDYLAALRNFVKQDAMKVRKEAIHADSKHGIDARGI